MLNGFGDAAAIEPRCATSWSREHGVDGGAPCGADMSRPDADRGHGRRRRRPMLGTVDILVNNAGIQHVAPIEEFPPAKWDAILAINLSAAFHTIRAAIPGMKAARLGPDRQRRLGARPDRLAVQVGLRRRQARHGRPDQGRRRWSSPRPASPATPSARAMSGRRWSRSRSTTRPSRHGIAPRAGRSATCCSRTSPTSASPPSRSWGRSTVFLCSPGAASITGTALPVDGGWTAH